MIAPSDAKAHPLLIKRVFDILLASSALVLLLPILILIGGFICLTMGTPVLFRQLRPGLHGKPFKIMKFRTMNQVCNESGDPLSDAERITRFGRFLRSTSLDELPELLNVLRGEMSLVGPRPLLMQYLNRYTPEQMRRHNAKPGVTGWAQVNGRNALTWEERFALDVWYVDHASLWLDIRIIAMTVLKIIRRENIAYPGQATMSEFMGTPPSPET